MRISKISLKLKQFLIITVSLISLIGIGYKNHKSLIYTNYIEASASGNLWSNSNYNNTRNQLNKYTRQMNQYMNKYHPNGNSRRDSVIRNHFRFYKHHDVEEVYNNILRILKEYNSETGENNFLIFKQNKMIAKFESKVVKEHPSYHESLSDFKLDIIKGDLDDVTEDIQNHHIKDTNSNVNCANSESLACRLRDSAVTTAGNTGSNDITWYPATEFAKKLKTSENLQLNPYNSSNGQGNPTEHDEVSTNMIPTSSDTSNGIDINPNFQSWRHNFNSWEDALSEKNYGGFFGDNYKSSEDTRLNETGFPVMNYTHTNSKESLASRARLSDYHSELMSSLSHLGYIDYGNKQNGHYYREHKVIRATLPTFQPNPKASIIVTYPEGAQYTDKNGNSHELDVKLTINDIQYFNSNLWDDGDGKEDAPHSINISKNCGKGLWTNGIFSLHAFYQFYKHGTNNPIIVPKSQTLGINSIDSLDSQGEEGDQYSTVPYGDSLQDKLGDKDFNVGRFVTPMKPDKIVNGQMRNNTSTDGVRVFGYLEDAKDGQVSNGWNSESNSKYSTPWGLYPSKAITQFPAPKNSNSNIDNNDKNFDGGVLNTPYNNSNEALLDLARGDWGKIKNSNFFTHSIWFGGNNSNEIALQYGCTSGYSNFSLYSGNLPRPISGQYVCQVDTNPLYKLEKRNSRNRKVIGNHNYGKPRIFDVDSNNKDPYETRSQFYNNIVKNHRLIYQQQLGMGKTMSLTKYKKMTKYLTDVKPSVYHAYSYYEAHDALVKVNSGSTREYAGKFTKTGFDKWISDLHCQLPHRPYINKTLKKKALSSKHHIHISKSKRITPKNQPKPVTINYEGELSHPNQSYEYQLTGTLPHAYHQLVDRVGYDRNNTAYYRYKFESSSSNYYRVVDNLPKYVSLNRTPTLTIKGKYGTRKTISATSGYRKSDSKYYHYNSSNDDFHANINHVVFDIPASILNNKNYSGQSYSVNLDVKANHLPKPTGIHWLRYENHAHAYGKVKVGLDTNPYTDIVGGSTTKIVVKIKEIKAIIYHYYWDNTKSGDSRANNANTIFSTQRNSILNINSNTSPENRITFGIDNGDGNYMNKKNYGNRYYRGTKGMLNYKNYRYHRFFNNNNANNNFRTILHIDHKTEYVGTDFDISTEQQHKVRYGDKQLHPDGKYYRTEGMYRLIYPSSKSKKNTNDGRFSSGYRKDLSNFRFYENSLKANNGITNSKISWRGKKTTPRRYVSINTNPDSGNAYTNTGFTQTNYLPYIIPTICVAKCTLGNPCTIPSSSNNNNSNQLVPNGHNDTINRITDNGAESSRFIVDTDSKNHGLPFHFNTTMFNTMYDSGKTNFYNDFKGTKVQLTILDDNNHPVYTKIRHLADLSNPDTMTHYTGNDALKKRFTRTEYPKGDGRPTGINGNKVYWNGYIDKKALEKDKYDSNYDLNTAMSNKANSTGFQLHAVFTIQQNDGSDLINTTPTYTHAYTASNPVLNEDAFGRIGTQPYGDQDRTRDEKGNNNGITKPTGVVESQYNGNTPNKAIFKLPERTIKYGSSDNELSKNKHDVDNGVRVLDDKLVMTQPRIQMAKAGYGLTANDINVQYIGHLLARDSSQKGTSLLTSFPQDFNYKDSNIEDSDDPYENYGSKTPSGSQSIDRNPDEYNRQDILTQPHEHESEYAKQNFSVEDAYGTEKIGRYNGHNLMRATPMFHVKTNYSSASNNVNDLPTSDYNNYIKHNSSSPMNQIIVLDNGISNPCLYTLDNYFDNPYTHHERYRNIDDNSDKTIDSDNMMNQFGYSSTNYGYSPKAMTENNNGNNNGGIARISSHGIDNNFRRDDKYNSYNELQNKADFDEPTLTQGPNGTTEYYAQITSPNNSKVASNSKSFNLDIPHSALVDPSNIKVPEQKWNSMRLYLQQFLHTGRYPMFFESDNNNGADNGINREHRLGANFLNINEENPLYVYAHMYITRDDGNNNTDYIKNQGRKQYIDYYNQYSQSNQQLQKPFYNPKAFDELSPQPLLTNPGQDNINLLYQIPDSTQQFPPDLWNDNQSNSKYWIWNTLILNQ